jgi:WG containing repeat
MALRRGKTFDGRAVLETAASLYLRSGSRQQEAKSTAVLSTNADATAPNAQPLGSSSGKTAAVFPILENDKWGYIDQAGKFVIPPKFKDAEGFSEGKAAVCVNSLWHNLWGNCWGYIDKTGRLVIRPHFYGAGHFLEGIAFVDTTDREVEEVGKWEYAFIDGEGKTLASPFHQKPLRSYHGVLQASVGQRRGYWDVWREVTLEPLGDEPHTLAGIHPPRSGDFGTLFENSVQEHEVHSRYEDGTRFFVNGHAPVRVELSPGYTYIDQNGTEMFGQFDGADAFSEGLARIEIEGRSGYIDRNGRTVIRPRFRWAREFSEGLARFSSGPVLNGKPTWGYIDRDGRVENPAALPRLHAGLS